MPDRDASWRHCNFGNMNVPINRRKFLEGMGSVVTFSILPNRLLASSPNGRLQIAQIGVGNRGKGNRSALMRLPNMDIVALCDVTETTSRKPKQRFLEPLRFPITGK